MLWDAGQARFSRERDERLVEAFVTGRDGYLAALSPGFVPAYVQSSASSDPRTAEDRIRGRDRVLAMLGRTFPGSVRA